MWSSIIWAVVVLIFMFLFKENIRNILSSLAHVGNKAQKLKYKNFSIDLKEDGAAIIGPQQGSDNTKHLQYLKAFQSNMITAEEQLITNQLVESKMTEAQALNVLITHLANANLLTKLLTIDRFIFKEQINLLVYLNSQSKFIPENELQPFYSEWKNDLGNETEYTFEEFLNFLSRQRLIAHNIDGYGIGPIGKEYLAFLIRIGRDMHYSKP